jgi:Na+/melibiose symporter-like transporter
VPIAASGAVLPIDLETTSVVVLAFPPMLMLWKAVQDDGQVSWVETAAMVCVFGIVVYLLAAHG